MYKYYNKKKIKNVFYGHEDPDKRTFRKAKKTLNLNGIKATFIKSPNCKNLYKSYLVNKKLNIPFISAKIAISKDHYSINKKNKWITNHKSRRIVHLLRSKHDCILSTSKTINSDNSLLNCRIHGLDNFKPDLFIIDLHLKLRKDLSLLKLIKKRKTFLITNKINYKKSLTFKKMGYKIVLIDSLNSKKEFISLYNKIYKLGYSRVLVETGLFFLKTLINNNVVNDLYMFKNNTILKQRGKNNVSPNFLKQIKFKKVLINLDNDKLYKKEF